MFDLGYSLDFSWNCLDVLCELLVPWKSSTIEGIPKFFLYILAVINSYLIFQIIQGFRKYNRKF